MGLKTGLNVNVKRGQPLSTHQSPPLGVGAGRTRGLEEVSEYCYYYGYRVSWGRVYSGGWTSDTVRSSFHLPWSHGRTQER